tara:strand:+ start:736 stop:4599 length:3864 start_codon:yes stop_codon:yes gene_type:complete
MSHNTGEKDFGSHTIDEQGRIVPNYISDATPAVTESQEAVLKHLRYDTESRKLIADRAIETTLNSLYLGEQHKMSSGAENIFFTNLGSDINFYPMWGGLKDQSLTANQGASGFIPPSGRVYTDLVSIQLGGQPDNTTSTGYSGGNYFGVNIAGMGITTVAAERVDMDVRLEYRLAVNDKQVYMQVLPRTSTIFPNDQIEWFFDHPVEIHAGTTIFAEIVKVRESDDVDLGVFQVRQGDTVDPSTGLPRYQATVHNRLFEDKDLELISPYLKYKAMDFSVDPSGTSILLKDLTLGADSLLIPHPINTLKAVAEGTEVKIQVKDGAKVIVESMPLTGVSINGSLVNSVLATAVTQLNDLFTNATGFASADTPNPVTGFALSGDDLTLTLSDGTSYTADVTTLGVDENNFVSSGTLNGNNLVLTMDDATTVTVDASGLAVDENAFVQSGTLNGTDLELTLNNNTTVTVDVAGLAVDDNDYIVSGQLNGTDLDLTLNTGSVVTVDATALTVDNDTVVTGGGVNGSDLEINLSDSSTVTIDASTLATGSSSSVASGAVVGDDLVLTMSDATTVTIDASNMINGSTLPAVSADWYVAYGSNAGDQVTVPTVVSSLKSKQPFYNGNFLNKGHEYTWTHDDNGTYALGVYTGSQTGLNESEVFGDTHWSTNFKFSTSTNTVRETSVGVDVSSRFASGYTISNSTVFALRYGHDNYLSLYDISNGGDVLIGRSNTALVGDTVTIFMGGDNQPNAKFPVFIEREQNWTIVHDYDNSENGILDGIEDHTVLRSNVSIEPNEKIMLDLFMQGRANFFGLNYTGASSGNILAEVQLDNILQYGTGEQLLATGTAEWSMNTSASNYLTTGAGQWRKGSGIPAGMVSLRYLSNNTVELWSEDENELIMTCNETQDGSPISLYFGVRENTNYSSYIPTVSKQAITQGSQPVVDFAPDVSDQSFDVTEGQAFNVQLALDSGSDIVNQYGETDAPNWAVLNQTTGIFNGTAPAYTGSSDSYVVACKAANVLGGVTTFNVTLNVLEQTYTNTKSLKFGDGVNSFLGANAARATSLERSSNGSGSADAWTIAFWYKRTTASQTGQTLFYYGNNDTTNNGYIEIKQTNNGRVRLRYGSNNNYLQLNTGDNAIAQGAWSHIVVTYDGGTTGASQSSLSDYYSRFKIYSNGVLQSLTTNHNNYGYTGSIVGQNYRFGKLVAGNYPKDGILNQLAIWNSDQSSNITGLYNGGSTQDISVLAAGVGSMNTNYLAPDHYYEVDTSVTLVQDLAGNADFVGYNFASSDLITDAP